MEHNESVREELLQTVDALTDRQVNEVVEEGVWSIAQNLEHLYLMEMSVAKGIKHAQSPGEGKPVKEKPVHLTVDRTTKVPAPPYLEPSTDFQTLGQLKDKLAQSRELLLQTIADLTKQEMDEKSFKHPVFGTLSIRQWVLFIGYHEERHRLQIEEVKKRLS